MNIINHSKCKILKKKNIFRNETMKIENCWFIIKPVQSDKRIPTLRMYIWSLIICIYDLYAWNIINLKMHGELCFGELKASKVSFVWDWIFYAIRLLGYEEGFFKEYMSIFASTYVKNLYVENVIQKIKLFHEITHI